MKKYQRSLLVWFCLITMTVIIIRYVTTSSPEPALLAKQLALAQARVDLQIQHLERNDAAVFYGVLAFVGIIGLSIVIVASGIHQAHIKKASVHVYKVGHSEIVVHERDLSSAWRIVTGLTNAEELKAINGGLDKALQLYSVMADVQSRQIQALLGKRGLPPALPVVNSPPLPAAPPAPIVAPVPTFQQLLHAGEIAQGKPMILGYANGVPRRGSFLDIYSAAVAGESGSGKTITLLYLIGSGIISCSVQFIALDPHYPHPKSLGFKTKPLWENNIMRIATTKDDMLIALGDVEQTIDRRLQQLDTETTPVVLVIDELVFLAKTSIGGNIARTMERISTEGRKCAVYLLASSQTWLAARTGESSVVRDTLTSAYVHRIKPKQANLLLQDKEEVQKVKKLKDVGEVLLCPVNDDSIVCRIPYTTQQDMACVSALVNRPVNSQPVDWSIDQASQRTGLVKDGAVDLVDRIKQTLQNEGDFGALVQSTGCDKAYISRILSRKQKMSEKVQQQFLFWLQQKNMASH